MADQSYCKSCNVKTIGAFCHAWGEKQIESTDFRLSKILTDGFLAFTNLDGKFWLTFRKLFFAPGLLSKENFEGRRINYMKPFQIFLICSIVFFLFMGDFDALTVPSQWFFVEFYEFGLPVLGVLRQKMIPLQLTQNEVAILYDPKVASYSKIGTLFLLPILASLTYVFMRKRMPEFGKHLIFAAHNFSFILILFTIYLVFFNLFGFLPYAIRVAFIFGTIFIYLTIASIGVWDLSLIRSFLITLPIFKVLFIIVFLYRIIISYLTLWLL